MKAGDKVKGKISGNIFEALTVHGIYCTVRCPDGRITNLKQCMVEVQDDTR
jgi:hypothetical protein